MLQIGIAIAIIIWFFISARQKGKNPILWMIVGAVSYYIPAMIFGRFIYPAIIGPVALDDLTTYMIIGAILSIGIGVVCCIAARSALMKLR